METGVKGVQLFRITEPVRCAPAVYEPTLVAIVSGTEEAILDGTFHVYDSSQYMCCAISMPVEKGIRLNNAAMRIAGGMTVNEPAMEVGYASPPQFSREFKRMYGQSPKQWSRSKQPLPAGLL